KRHRVADVEKIGLKPVLLGFSIPATAGAATSGLWLQPWRVCRIASIFAFLFSNVDDLSTLRKVEGWQRARVARLSNLHRRTLASYCDDDNFWCSMRALLRPVSWLGSHTKHVTAATSSLWTIVELHEGKPQQHRDAGGANLRLHSSGLTPASTTNGDNLNTSTSDRVRSVCVVRCWFECSSEETLRMSANSASCRVQSLLTSDIPVAVGDDDQFLFSMRGLPSPVSWLGSPCQNKMWPEATILHFLLLNPNKDDRP
ncbi:hypothetical protein Tco_0849132, partial [Tanacetum coccineum]